MTDKAKIVFIQDYVKDDSRKGTAGQVSYKKGQTVEFGAATARHYVRRGLCKYASDEDQTKATAAPVPGGPLAAMLAGDAGQAGSQPAKAGAKPSPSSRAVPAPRAPKSKKSSPAVPA